MWADSCTVEVGGWRMGIRSSRAEVGALIVDVFAPYLVDDDVPGSWSLRVGGFEGEPEERLHLLYRSNRQVARSRRPSRVLRALAFHVSSFVDRDLPGRPTGAVLVLLPDDRGVLLPAAARRHLIKLTTHLEAAGFRIADVPDPRVDLMEGTVIVPEPILALDEQALAELDDRFGGDDLEAVRTGEYPIAGWVMEPGDARAASPVAASTAVIARAFRPVSDDAQEFLERAAELAGRTATWTARVSDRRQVIAALEALAA